MKNMKLGRKLIVMSILIGLLPLVLMGGLSFWFARSELELAVEKTNDDLFGFGN